MSWAVVAHTFNLSTREAEANRSKFEGSLVYRGSSGTARAIQGNPASKGVRRYSYYVNQAGPEPHG